MKWRGIALKRYDAVCSFKAQVTDAASIVFYREHGYSIHMLVHYLCFCAYCGKIFNRIFSSILPFSPVVETGVKIDIHKNKRSSSYRLHV